MGDYAYRCDRYIYEDRASYDEHLRFGFKVSNKAIDYKLVVNEQLPKVIEAFKGCTSKQVENRSWFTAASTKSWREVGMKSLLSDWCAFCEGRAVFDKSHFLGLLKAQSGSEELRRIFSYFPFSEELADRTERVLASGDIEKSLYLLPRLKVGKDELIQLGWEWFKEQERVCGVLGDSEVLKICESAQVLFVDGHDIDHWLQQDIPHYWLFDEIGDAIRESRVSDTEQTYALFEAFYGLAADYYLAWYIGQPLFKFDIDLASYFKFWGAGGRCALTESGFLVANQE